jgi:hypothetical protein
MVDHYVEIARGGRFIMSLTDTQEQLLKYLKLAAVELSESDSVLISFFTSLIGELSACKLLNLSWEPSEGYDAVGPKPTNERYQIKTRRASGIKAVLGKHKPSSFGKRNKYDFDKGLYVELDREFEVREIRQLFKNEIISLEDKDVKQRRMHVRDIKKIGTVVYPKGGES